MPHERIEFIDDPRLNVFRSLKAQNAVRDAHVFVAEGATVIDRVLRSNYDVLSVMISDRKFAAFEDRFPATLPVYRVNNQMAEAVVGFDFHCGIIACVARRTAPPIESWLPSTGPALVLAGDRIVDPENVGSLIRIASAFGAVSVIFGKGSVDPFSRRVLRVSMGNVLYLPIVETDDLPGYLNCLITDHGCRVCSTVLDPDAAPLSTFSFPPRTVLLFGNEFHGISEETKQVPSTRLTIPMLNNTDSLNVAISAGIFSHQFRSQHGTTPP